MQQSHQELSIIVASHKINENSVTQLIYIGLNGYNICHFQSYLFWDINHGLSYSILSVSSNGPQIFLAVAPLSLPQVPPAKDSIFSYTYQRTKKPITREGTGHAKSNQELCAKADFVCGFTATTVRCRGEFCNCFTLLSPASRTAA